MKPTDTLTTLFSHHLWANVRLLEKCATLTDEQLDTSILGVFGSIRETLQHMVNSEQFYLHRIRTGQPLASTRDSATLTIAEMLDMVRTSGAGLIEWATKVQADDTVTVRWKDDWLRQVPKSIILNQALNHALEHRTQITAVLTQLGIEPPELQPWEYFEEMDSSSES